jgi:surface antigen
VAAAGILAKVGQAYVSDQVFFGGAGTKMAKETIKAMGMAGITAYTMARGGYDIKWYDKQGNRVG